MEQILFSFPFKTVPWNASNMQNTATCSLLQIEKNTSGQKYTGKSAIQGLGNISIVWEKDRQH